MNVYEKLQAARIRLQNAPLKKSGHNKFAGYHYFELGDFLPTVQDIFSELGLCGVVAYTEHTAFLDIINIEEPTQKIMITSPMGSASLKGCHEVQNIGAVETYQRRYLWVTAMEIVENDVLDATTKKEDFSKLDVRPTSGADEGVDKERKPLLDRSINHIIEQLAKDDPYSAYAEYDNYQGEERIYIRSKLNSKQKSSLKSIADAEKAAA